MNHVDQPVILVVFVEETQWTTPLAHRVPVIHAVCAAWDGDGLMITLQYHTQTGNQPNQQEERYVGALAMTNCGVIGTATDWSDTFVNEAEQELQVSSTYF